MEGMSTSSHLRMITLGSDMFTLWIRGLMPWTNSLNLRQNQKTNWVNVSRHFDLIGWGVHVYSIRFFSQGA